MARIDVFLDELLARGGLALHLAGGWPPLARRGGALEPLGEEILDADELRRMLVATLDAAGRARLARDFSVEIVHVHRTLVRFAARCSHDAGGLSAVLRVLPSRPLSLDDLGCPDALKQAGARRSGLILCAGPRGSGRTVTIAAMVDHVNRTRSARVLTIERPLEIQHGPGTAQILQREVPVDAPSFAAALRSAGSEDFDVVTVSDLADTETVTAALELAASGTLVVAGVTARGAVRAVEMVARDADPSRSGRARGLLAEALVAVVAIELLPRMAGSGVVAAHELLLGSAALAAMIRDERSEEIQELMLAGGAVGMQTMDVALERLASRGVIRAEDALARANDREAMHRALLGRRPTSAPPQSL